VSRGAAIDFVHFCLLVVQIPVPKRLFARALQATMLAGKAQQTGPALSTEMVLFCRYLMISGPYIGAS
jgi:hypothetical protein